ncbi:MAG: hypothetical protein M3R01_02835 [Actinomycetota bacterium]|nr:hypothetical protein [Actinomycetota bacterium]
MAFSREAMPANVAGVHIDPTDWNRADGFSPGGPVITFAKDLDLATTGAAPITDIARSRRGDAPIVLLDADTGERHPYFAELDANAVSDRDRLLFVRPARNLTEGHRYVVALRGLRDGDGDLLRPDATFKRFRDGATLRNRTLRERRPRMERLFDDLAGAGVDRADLYLAWDFTVASERSLAGRMLHIRDDAYAALGSGVPRFVGSAIAVFRDGPIATQLGGTFEVPNYLTGTGQPGSRFNLGPDGLPRRNGTFTAEFFCIIPRSATAANPARGVVYGHGLLGDSGEILGFGEFANEANIVFCATDEIGMASEDIPNVIAITGDLSNFPSLADRLQQGILNMQFLARLLKDPRGFATDSAFQDPVSGAPIVATGEVFYNGNSQGGILGGATTAVSKEWTRAVLGVPAANYSTLLHRSVDFDPFDDLQEAAYTDEVDRQLGVALIQMLWDRGESNGYAAHLTDDPLPNTPPHEVLLIEAFGDHQVANVATETMARTIGAKVHAPALAPGRSPDVTPLWDIPPVPSDPYDGSVLVVWDYGTPAPPTVNLPPRPPEYGEDPHGKGGDEPRVLRQASEFLRTDGAFVDTCAGGPCQSDV